jgi:hypothetical protein
VITSLPQPIVEDGSSIQGRVQDGAKIEDFKHLYEGKNISSTYLISITSLPEDEEMYKHGRGGRYNAILEFKRGVNKKMNEKKKKEKNGYKEKRKNMRKRKEKKYEYV